MGRIITVAQQKGGSGKTTVAAHLAVALARLAGAPSAVLDVDPQGSLGEWFETREARLGEGRTGLSFRTASGWGARREARALARDHAFVLLDTPPKSDLDSRPALEAADLVLPRAALGAEVEAAIRALGRTTAATRLGNRVAFAAAMGEGLTAPEQEPAGKAAAEIEALSREILALLGGVDG